MRKVHFQILILVLFSINASSAGIKSYIMSSYKRTYIEAERLLNNENYDDALPLFLLLDSMDNDNTNIKYKVGFCYLNASAGKVKAIPYFLAASKNIATNYKKNDLKEKHAPPYTFKYLAKAYQLNYEFDKAIGMYLKYKETLGTSRKLTAEVEGVLHGIETCTNGIELLKAPKGVKVANVGEGVNSKYADYSPVISNEGSTLLFTSRRPIGKGDVKNIRGVYDEDIYTAELGKDSKWKNIKLMDGEINTTGNDRIINTSFDGSLIICKDDGNDENLYLSTSVNGVWKAPQYWGSGVNTVADETSASITADGRILYFVSNREGGFGGSDIYKCIKLPNGKWGMAQNLGSAINTKYDEDAVFVHPNGREIFFSSQGNKSMGGFDIFSSIIDPENGFLSSPLSAGYPINTTSDDLFFKIGGDGKVAYLASDRVNGLGGMDIYQVSYPEENEKRDITLIVGRIINNSKEDLSDNLILVIDKNTHEIIQEVEANNATGKFGIDLPIGSTYDIQYFIKGKEIHKETIEVKSGNGYQVLLREIPYGN